MESSPCEKKTENASKRARAVPVTMVWERIKRISPLYSNATISFHAFCFLTAPTQHNIIKTVLQSIFLENR